ncbi:MAG: O-antigen ligase family protein [Elusimicrobia bacterium]|nr:O-antigen ligase family protein [Elusimicrobiota bacterium]
MFINLLFSILLFFVPLSFAGTEPWAFFIFQIAISFIFIYLLFVNGKFRFTLPALFINFIFIIFIVLAIIQLLNHHNIVQQKNLIPFTVSPYNTLKELNGIFTYMVFFIIATQLFYKFEKIKKILYLTMVVAAIVVFIGLCFPKGEYVKFFLGTGSLGNFGPFTNRNNAGIFLSISFFISLSLIFYNFLKYQKYLVHNKKSEFVVVQIVNTILSFMLLISVIVTRSRGAMLATFVSIFIFSYLYAYHLSKNFKEKILKIIIISVIMMASSFIIYKNMDAINEYSQRITGTSEQTRLKLYDMSFDILKDYPITGIGFAAFPVLTDKYLNEDLNAYPEYLHNDWLELLLDIGYPIYTIFLLLVFIIIYLLLKRIKHLSNKKKILFIGLFSACCSICIGSFVDFHFHIPANAMLFFICLALLCSLSFHKDKRHFSLNNNLLVKFVFCILIICSIFFSYKNVMSWKYYVFSKNMPKEQEIEYLNRAADISKNPRYLETYIITLYNYCISNKEKMIEQKDFLNLLVYKYLNSYPYNKKISKIYGYLNF